MRINQANKQGYYLKDFEDAFSRYLPPLQAYKQEIYPNNSSDNLTKDGLTKWNQKPSR